MAPSANGCRDEFYELIQFVFRDDLVFGHRESASCCIRERKTVRNVLMHGGHLHHRLLAVFTVTDGKRKPSSTVCDTPVVRGN